MRLPYSRQTVGAEEAAAVAAAVQDALLTGGPRLERFEAELAAACGARHAIAVSSGTAALHVAYLAAGVTSGDTVLTAPITFVATANAAFYCGAEPIFADVNAHGSLDQLAVARAIENGARPRVVVPVHYAGHPAAIEAIVQAAPGALVIEDACHALGAEYRDEGGTWRRIGACAHSAMAVMSFHPVKTITTGEGGAILTNDAALAAHCRRLRSHGVERERDLLESSDGPWWYEQQELGFNYRLTDLQAALGSAQLGRLAGFVHRRRSIAALYDELLAEEPFVNPVTPPSDTRSAYHLYAVRVPAGIRRAVVETLHGMGIGVQVHYIPVHLQPYYRRRLGTTPGQFPQAEAFYREVLSLPCFPEMTDTDVHAVVVALRAAAARAVRGVSDGRSRHANLGAAQEGAPS